jgi:cyclic pyranopterin phosphate synthase
VKKPTIEMFKKQDFNLRNKPVTVYWLNRKLYLNITNKCSNHCLFCIRNFQDGVGSFILRLPEEPLIDRIITDLEAVSNTKNWTEAVFCGFGEPTERLDCLLEITRWLRRRYDKSLNIRVNTNGQGELLNPGRKVAKELKAAGVDKLSVSINAHNEILYNEVCRPQLKNAYKAVLEFIELAKQELETEITAVVIPEVDIQKVEKFAQEKGVNLRKRPFNQPYIQS